MIYLRLFWEFFKTGLFSVGGGLATLPFLNDMAVRTGWFTTADVADMLAVAESTPGPIGVNMATFAGYTAAGVFGSVCATVGLVTPGLVIMLLVTRILVQFRQNRFVDGAFYGLRPASAGLIAAAVIGVAVESLFYTDAWAGLGGLFRWKAWLLSAALTVLLLKRPKWHPLAFIGIAAVCGAVFRLGGV